MMRGKILNLLVFVSCLVLLCASALGFGIATPYMPDKTLVMSPGEVRDLELEVQNSKPEMADVEFKEFSPIATILNEKEFYTVGGDKVRQPITLRIAVPLDALPGTVYEISYWAGVASNAKDAQAPVSLGMSGAFFVKLEKPTPKPVEQAAVTQKESPMRLRASISPGVVVLFLSMMLVVVVALMHKTHRPEPKRKKQ